MFSGLWDGQINRLLILPSFTNHEQLPIIFLHLSSLEKKCVFEGYQLIPREAMVSPKT